MTLYRHSLGDPLSAKELRVLYWLSHGNSNASVGVRMHITEPTVKTHVGAVMLKLGAHDRAHAVRLGFERGLLHADRAAVAS